MGLQLAYQDSKIKPCEFCGDQLLRYEGKYGDTHYCGNTQCARYAQKVWTVKEGCCRNPQPVFVQYPTKSGVRVRKRCNNCFTLFGHTYKFSERPNYQNDPLHDNDDSTAIYEERSCEWNRFKDDLLQKRSNKARDAYTSYLKSDEWWEVRRKVLKRDNFTCQACLSATATQVHHKTYAHYNKGREVLFDLISVCNKCHDFLHNNGNNNG